MKILTFKLFEAKLADVLKTNVDKFKEYTNREFKYGELKKYIMLNNNKVKNIRYYDNEKHKLISRIKERTNFDSVDEFNKILDKALNKVLNNKRLFNKLRKPGDYNLYLEDYNLSIIFFYSHTEYFENNTIVIKTIVNRLMDQKMNYIFYIKDLEL
jgi:hypothetical protein